MGLFSKSKQSVPSSVEKAFETRRVGYILLACSEPNNDGEMEVAMDYAGDPVLISYLLEHAKERIEQSIC